MEELLARAERQEAARRGTEAQLLTAGEAERIVEGLRAFPLEQFGTPAWFAQHDQLERLNLQAHANAQARSEEYVKEALVSLGKVGLLVEELLAAEAWRERLLPLLRNHLAEHVDSVASYQLLYHEAALANLLEVVLFHPDACEAMGEEAVLELADWCSRRLACLTSPEAQRHAKYTELSAQQLLTQTAEEELCERESETAFGAANCALTLLRYLTDSAPRLSLSVLTRIASTNDAAMALLALLQRPPWVRKGRGGQQEHFIGGQWQPVDPANRLAITQQEAQVWLALNNLVVDPLARTKLDLTAARCETLLKLQDCFSELLFDQLPVLRDLQRVISELACGVNTASAEPMPSKLIVEQVPALRTRLLARSDWQELAAAARAQQFGRAAAGLSRQRLEAMMRSLDFLCDVQSRPATRGPAEAGGAQGSEPAAVVKVDAYRHVSKGVWEWWATYSLDINTDRPAECITASTAAGKTAYTENQPRQPEALPQGGIAPEQQAERKLHGLRYRLRPLSEGLHRALPAEGKLSVLYGGCSFEAALRLPSSETRDTSALAATLWLTVGDLTSDGLALQLKLKRLHRPSERDKVTGHWFAYVPVGGGLTVREGLLDES